MSFVDVNGIKICYEIQGEGEPLILVHGFGVKKEVWMCQFGPISEKFKVIRFDNRGAGKSDHPDELFTMEMLADDIRGLMDALNLDKAHVVAWSLGGMFAQHFAIKYPERLNKLVLINTLPNWPGGDEAGIKMYVDGQLASIEAYQEDPIKAFFERAPMGYSRKFKKEMQEDTKKKFHGLFSVEDYVQMKTTNIPTPKDIENQANALKHHDVLDQLHLIKSETLIITADKDRQTPMSRNQIIHEKIPNSKIVVIAGAGHDSPLEKAPEINKHIIDFLS
jgi:proline-specific peptidase